MKVATNRARAGHAPWLALLGLGYAGALWVSSWNSGPALWGLHMAAFLPSATRALLLILALLGAALLIWESRSHANPRPGSKAARARGPSLATAFLLFALPLFAVLFWTFRVRSYFLGDGIVFVLSLVSGRIFQYSEPLASKAWEATVLLIRNLGARVDPNSLAVAPVVCGLAAVPLIWMLAAEIAPGKNRLLAAGLLLTLGASQLYFGYIESYPFISLAILLYLYTSARALRTGSADILPGLALAVAVASHVITVYLIPSYIWLVLHLRVSRLRKASLLLLPFLAAGGLFLAMGFGPEELLRPFRHAFTALGRGESLGFTARGLLSARHWVDLANIVLLILPGPLILLTARALSKGTTTVSSKAVLSLLVIAALPGLVGTAFLVVPSSPAQDWDLLAIMLLPTAAAAITAGIPMTERSTWRGPVGICLLAGVGLFSFVLVNANEGAGIRRFEVLVGDDAWLAPHERAYGNEKLATFYADRGDFRRAHVHAQRAVRAEPTNPRYWVKAGAVLFELGQLEEAIPYFQEGLRRAPHYADASYNLGVCYLRMRRVPEAIASFRDAVRENGDLPSYRHNLGVALFAAGKVDSARLVWTEVLQRRPTYSYTLRSMQKYFGAAAPIP